MKNWTEVGMSICVSAVDMKKDHHTKGERLKFKISSFFQLANFFPFFQTDDEYGETMFS